MQIILLIVISSVLIFGIEILKRRFCISTDITRRLIHVTTATVAGLAPLFATPDQIIITCIVFIAALLYGRRSNIFSAIHSVERKTFGEVYLPLGVALAALVFLPNDIKSFQFGVFVMGIADPLAGMVGERFGKHFFTIFNNKKSIEGSTAFLLTSFALTLLFFPTFGYELITVSLILTLVEFGLVYGLDNLVLPILGAFLFRLFA